MNNFMVTVADGSAAISAGLSGGFDCVYTVDEGVLEVDVRISVPCVVCWCGLVCFVRLRL